MSRIFPVISSALSGIAVVFACSIAFAQHPSLPSPAIPDGLGVAIHFTEAQPGEMKKIADSGVKWVRMDMVWDQTELKKNIYNFDAYDRFTQALDEHGLKVVFILDYANSLYDKGLSPHSDEARQAFARWAVAAATRYAGKGYLWELWNEPNGDTFWFPHPKVEDYVKLALEVGKAFQKAGLQEPLVGPGVYRFPHHFLETCFKAGLLKDWAAVTIHPYRWWFNPETAAVFYLRAKNLISKYAPAGKEIPVLSGEWGYSSVQRGLNETLQAQFLARMWLNNYSQGVPLSIWYDWKDDGDNPKEKEHHFGIVGRDFRQEKPAYRAAKTLIDQLRGFSFDRRLDLPHSQDYALVFRKGQETRLAVWTSSNARHSVTLEAVSGYYIATDYLGKKVRRLASNTGGLKIALEGGPQYLIPESQAQ